MKYRSDDLIGYVIYREMAQFIERKHNRMFLELITSKFQKYQENEKGMSVYWFLIQRIEGGSNRT